MYINSNQLSSMIFCAFQSCIVLACDSNDSESYQICFNIQHPLRGLSTDLWNHQLCYCLALNIDCIKVTVPTAEILRPFRMPPSKGNFFFLYIEPGTSLHFDKNLFLTVYQSKLRMQYCVDYLQTAVLFETPLNIWNDTLIYQKLAG